MNRTLSLLAYTLDEQRYALHLDVVTRVVRAVEVTILPDSPAIIAGIVNVYGEIVPVINIRKRFRIQDRELETSDQFIIARTSRRPVALVVDSITGVIGCPEHELIKAEKALPDRCAEKQDVKGLLRLEDGMILVHDLDRFLSLEDEEVLDNALQQETVRETAP